MRVALVTGGSRGIGEGIARKLAVDGYCVILTYKKNNIKADKVCADIIASGGNARAFKCDISIKADIINLFDMIKREYHRLDVLVNNAGISYITPFLDISEEQWDETFNVNVKGVFLCSQMAASMMLSRGGKIINITSIWGETGASCEVDYSASKAAIIGMTKSLAKELAPSSITVNCVSCGMIDTDMNKHLPDEEINDFVSEIPLGRVGAVADIAAAVSYLASSGADYVTGEIIKVNGGYYI